MESSVSLSQLCCQALKASAEEYGRILELVGRYAVYKENVAFSCKKQVPLSRPATPESCKGHRIDTVQERRCSCTHTSGLQLPGGLHELLVTRKSACWCHPPCLIAEPLQPAQAWFRMDVGDDAWHGLPD